MAAILDLHRCFMSQLMAVLSIHRWNYCNDYGGRGWERVSQMSGCWVEDLGEGDVWRTWGVSRDVRGERIVGEVDCVSGTDTGCSALLWPMDAARR